MHSRYKITENMHQTPWQSQITVGPPTFEIFFWIRACNKEVSTSPNDKKVRGVTLITFALENVRP